MILNQHIMLLIKLDYLHFLRVGFLFKSCRNPLFTVLWNLRVKSTQVHGHFKWCPMWYLLSMLLDTSSRQVTPTFEHMLSSKQVQFES